MNALAIFLVIYQSQSKHRRLLLKKIIFEKNFVTYFYGWGSAVSRIQNDHEETITTSV